MTTHVGPAVAGTFYPGSAAELDREVARLLIQAGAWEASTSTTTLIAPHAGYAWSGAVAGAGFRLLRGSAPRRVLLLGPSHYEAYEGGAIPAADAYRTPLGDVPIDDAARDQARASGIVRVVNRPFAREHSLEVELPFLQRVLAPGFRIVPVLVGAGCSSAGLQALAAALGPLRGPETLTVVSSDFTHFGRHFDFVPFSDNVPARIRDLDSGAIERILARDVAGFEGYVARTGATICGRLAISVLLRLLPAGARGELVAYDTSGRISGDFTHTVSYASIVFRERTE